MNEIPVSFECEGHWLYGLVHAPARAAGRGLLVVVGGPQYRTGSHRQFTVLARRLAAEGIPVLRFDYRGMGDSEGAVGAPEPCEHLSADIRAAVDALFGRLPRVQEIVIWGLCDGASAALMYAPHDDRVAGVVALNPWVSTEQGKAKAYLKHYYLARLFSPGLWSKVRRGEFNVRGSLKSLMAVSRTALGRKAPARPAQGPAEGGGWTPVVPGGDRSIADRMADGLERFGGRTLIILSGNDLVASEFKDAVGASRRWRRLIRSDRVTRQEHPDADHTFSRRQWGDDVAAWTADWMRSW